MCLTGVFLGYACAAGRALLDVRLYLPRSWVAGRAGCAAAGIPADIEFATKSQPALQMIARGAACGYHHRRHSDPATSTEITSAAAVLVS